MIEKIELLNGDIVEIDFDIETNLPKLPGVRRLPAQEGPMTKFHCLGCGRFVRTKRWYVSYNGWHNVQRVSYTCSSCGECDWPLT